MTHQYDWTTTATPTPRVGACARAQARQVWPSGPEQAAAAIRRKATYHGLVPGERKPADVATAYRRLKGAAPTSLQARVDLAAQWFVHNQSRVRDGSGWGWVSDVRATG